MLRMARRRGKGELRPVGARRVDLARDRRLPGEKVGQQARREPYSGPLGRVAGYLAGADHCYCAWGNPA
ncbi:MAG: hypothetical protein JXA33_20730 [Anaerolineae bacterium]|nr:hypothetical protein [Anaerolineae bacterium]